MNSSSLSLNEQIKAICKSSTSKTKKVNDIVKLGIPRCDARVCVDIYGENTTDPSPRVRRATYTFGVELEIANTNRRDVETHLAANGVTYAYEGYNHTTRRHYKFVRDSSLNGDNPIECVSPVLKSSAGFKSLKATCKALNDAGCSVNRTCGFHVHIGAESLTEEQYCSVFVNYMHLENVIDTFMAPSRRANASRWCHTLRGKNIQRVYTRDYLNRALSYDRYFKVNPCSYDRHKTIEFRQHAGTLNYEKIEMWVKFVAKLVDWSKTHRLESDVNNIDELEFLTKAEKTYFKRRAAEFAARAAA